MKKTMFLLSALLTACAAEAPETEEEKDVEIEILEQTIPIGTTYSWSVDGPNGSRSGPQRGDFTATVTCTTNSRGKAQAQFYVRNNTSRANYRVEPSVTLSAKKSGGVPAARTTFFAETYMQAGGSTKSFTVTNESNPLCNYVTGSIKLKYIEPIN